MLHFRSALFVGLLGAAPVARAESPAREPLTIAEPTWKAGTPRPAADHPEALARLQSMAANFPEGPPLQITSPQPCVLRISRGHDLPAYRDSSRMFVHHVTWIDLSRATRVEAQAFGTMTPAGDAMAATCGWLSGPQGFALATEVVALANRSTANRRVELSPEEQPRLCLGGEVDADQLESALQALVVSCKVR